VVDGQQTITADGKIDRQAGGKQTDRQTDRRTGSKIRRQKDTTAQQTDRRAPRKTIYVQTTVKTEENRHIVKQKDR